MQVVAQDGDGDPLKFKMVLIFSFIFNQLLHLTYSMKCW